MIKTQKIRTVWSFMAIAWAGAACGVSTSSNSSSLPDCSSGTTSSNISTSAPQWIRDWFTCVKVTVSGSNMIIQTKAYPPYTSYYWGFNHTLYESMPAGNSPNPNSIESQNYSFTIPATMASAGSTSATSLGAIGVSVKGSLLYNNSAAPPDSLSNELATMDKGNGHPDASGNYHHHTEPTKFTNNDNSIVGVIRDGYPLLGRKDTDGTTPSDLDACNGHTKAVSHSSLGTIYHYHVTSADPYFIGCYRGTAGTYSN